MCSSCVSSIVVPYGLELALYSQDYFQGNFDKFTAGQHDLVRQDGGKFNDKLRSMKVKKIGKLVPSGAWRQVASNNDDLSTTITVGFKKGTSESTEKEFSLSLTVGVEVGGDIYGGKATTSATTGSAIRNTVGSSMEANQEEAITATCNNPNHE
jgi:hypothetical protein